MNLSTLLLIGGMILILLITKQVFWVSVAGILFLFYAVALTSTHAGKGMKSAASKAHAVYAGELKDIEAFTGKYPAKFYDSVGKGIMEKVNEHQAPKGAKSYRDAENYKWEIKDPMGKLVDSASKIVDSIGKLFSR